MDGCRNRPLSVYTKEWVVDMRIIRNSRDRASHRPERREGAPRRPARRDAVRKLWQWSALPLAGCAVVAVFSAVMQITLAASTEAGMPADTGYILIDPGHGGADGGAQAADGTLEKDINLAVALPLNDMLKVCGYPVKMTRDTDISVHSDSARTLREQKVSDMHNRLALYDKAKAAVGIHTNKFPQTQYFGTQLFYSANCPESEGIASAIRESVVGLLQPKNTREMKKADSNIFLLDKAKVPAVFVECGFLSNEGELAKLKNPDYQHQMALAILNGLLQYGL